MSGPPYMQLWIADFVGDTLHLSDAEVGQYILLLMAMWRNGGYLPDDPNKLARIARSAVSEDVLAFFEHDLANARICQKRLLVELGKADTKSQSRSEAGRRGGLAKSLKSKKAPVANAKQLPSNCSSKQGSKPLAKPCHLSESDIEKETPPNGGAKKETPAMILAKVLDLERATAVVEHRKSKRARLTKRAAELLARSFAKCSDPNAAADMMIARGWQGFEPEWMENANDRANGSGRGKPERTEESDCRAILAGLGYGPDGGRPGDGDEGARGDGLDGGAVVLDASEFD